MVEPVDLQKLLTSAIAGDEHALGLLLDHFRSQLRETIRANIKDQLQRRIDESDVMQQACVQAVQRFKQFRGKTIEEFWGWLEQIQRNTLIDLARHHKAQKRDANNEQNAANLAHLAGRATTASQRAMRSERKIRLQAVLEELPPDQRQAMQLRHLQEFKVAEIAKAMDRSEEAVAGLLKRGMAAIKEKLGKESM